MNCYLQHWMTKHHIHGSILFDRGLERMWYYPVKCQADQLQGDRNQRTGLDLDSFWWKNGSGQRGGQSSAVRGFSCSEGLLSIVVWWFLTAEIPQCFKCSLPSGSRRALSILSKGENHNRLNLSLVTFKEEHCEWKDSLVGTRSELVPQPTQEHSWHSWQLGNLTRSESALARNKKCSIHLL